MAVSVRCRGWGKATWGKDPWGSGVGTSSPPTITSISPPCGATDVNVNTPIILKVCGGPCSYVAGAVSGTPLDCIQITINGTLVYDGTGLTLPTINNGFKSPCNQACSAVTTEITTDPTDPTLITNFCYIFKFCCSTFACDSKVTIEATFCDMEGNTVVLSNCSFTTAPCNYISNVEIIDSRHVVIRFSNHMLANPVLNKALYDATSYKVVPVSGGFVVGDPVEVKAVLVEKTFLPKTVILETNSLTRGAMYEVVGDVGILDLHRQPLISKGMSTFLARTTKVDEMVNTLPKMYKQRLNNSLEDKQRVVSIWQIFAAMGIEDERMGGDY